MGYINRLKGDKIMAKKRVVFEDNSSTVITIQNEAFWGTSLKVYINNESYDIKSESDAGMLVSSQFGKKIKRIENAWYFPNFTGGFFPSVFFLF